MIDSRTIVNTHITDAYTLDIYNEPHKDQLVSAYYLDVIAPVVLDAHFGESSAQFLSYAISVFTDDGRFDIRSITPATSSANCSACCERVEHRWEITKDNKYYLSWYLCKYCHATVSVIAEIYHHMWCVSTTKHGFSAMADISEETSTPEDAKAHITKLVESLKT